MSVMTQLSGIELWFALGAMALTAVVGIVLLPAMRNALSDEDER